MTHRFDSFDTNKDGMISIAEFEANLFPKTRAKIEEKLDQGWKFDKAKWEASIARHAKWDMGKVFKRRARSESNLAPPYLYLPYAVL